MRVCMAQHSQSIETCVFAWHAVQQVAYADRVLLNKVDLVDDAHKKDVVRRIKVGTFVG